MKKILLSLTVFTIFTISAHAAKFPDIPYKNISNKDRIVYDSTTDTWSKKADKKQGNYFTKIKGFGDFYDYLDSSENFAFTTGCEYEFIYNNSLVGYSNTDMKFYDITYINGGLSKRALSKEEVQKILPEYNVICLSEFSKMTNSYKIKKHIGELKILILNDTDKTFDNFVFTSGNARFKTYDLRGFISILKQGMIQFSSSNQELSDGNWYILLVR